MSFSPRLIPFSFSLQFNDLQECYLQKRHQFANHPQYQPEREKNVIPREGYGAGLADFQSVSSTFTQIQVQIPSSFLLEMFFYVGMFLFHMLVIYMYFSFVSSDTVG